MQWLLPCSCNEHFLKAGELCRQRDLGDPGFARLLGPRHQCGLASRWRLVPCHSLGTGAVGVESGAAASHHTSTPTSAPPQGPGERGDGEGGEEGMLPHSTSPIRGEICSTDSKWISLALQKQSLFCSLSLTYHTTHWPDPGH